MPVTRQDFPVENAAELTAYYGAFKLGSDGRPTAAWEEANLVRVKCPWRMVLSWDTSKVATAIRCHKKVAPSLREILAELWSKHGKSQARIERSGLHLYGGCYEFRRIRGANRVSLHSYGAAIDWDPKHNPLGAAWKPNTGMMAEVTIQIFTDAGWKWGGKFTSRKDPMHFQAAA